MRCQSLAKWMSVFLVMIVSAVAAHAQAPAGPKTATQAYTDYLAALPAAKSVNDITKYLSAAKVKQINTTPAAQRPQMFGMMQMMAGMYTGIKVTKETPTSAGATLAATAKDPDGKPAKGVIKMVKEGGVWKVDDESWTS